MADATGARVVVAKVPFPFTDSSEIVDAVLAAVSPKTRLALIDHVTSPTAVVLPVAAITAALTERGVETLIDGAHAAGMLDLEVSALGALAYTGNLHKWPCAPKGSAFLWVRPDAQAWMRPTVISHGACEQTRRFRAEHDWIGTLDPTPWLATPAALNAVAGLVPGGWPTLRALNHSRAVLSRRLLEQQLGAESPCPATSLGSLALVRLPGAKGAPCASARFDTLQETLSSRYRIEVPIIHWPDGETRWVRVSFHVYNRLEQVAFLGAALQEQCAEDRMEGR